MEYYVNNPEQKFMSAEFQIFITYYHIWGYSLFVLEDILQGGLSRLPKWKLKARNIIYPGNSPFHAGSVALIFNIITELVSPQYHVVFDDTFSTVENTSKGTVPGNRKNLV